MSGYFDKQFGNYLPDEIDEIKVHECEHCGQDIMAEDTCYKALGTEYFCSMECLEKYYEIEEVIAEVEERSDIDDDDRY